MPVITIQMWEGRSLEQKRELVEVFTREMTRIAQCKESSVHIIIQDAKKENWGLAGQLASEKFPD